jgi:hypothetical protein
MVYPLPAQLRLLMDLAVLGHDRIFDLEALAADPLLEFLAGGYVPSIDTLYDDLRRFDDKALRDLDAMVSEHGLAPLRSLKPTTMRGQREAKPVRLRNRQRSRVDGKQGAPLLHLWRRVVGVEDERTVDGLDVGGWLALPQFAV